MPKRKKINEARAYNLLKGTQRKAIYANPLEYVYSVFVSGSNETKARELISNINIKAWFATFS